MAGEVRGSLIAVGHCCQMQGGITYICNKLEAEGLRISRVVMLTPTTRDILGEIERALTDEVDFLIILYNLGLEIEGSIQTVCDLLSDRFSFEKNGILIGRSCKYKTICFILPADSSSCEKWIEKVILDRIQSEFSSSYPYRKRIIRVQELGISEVSKRVEDLGLTNLQWECLDKQVERWIVLYSSKVDPSLASELISKGEQKIRKALGSHYISSREEEPIEQTIGLLLRRKGIRLAIAESCTGGLLSARITSIPGSSEYFDRAFITYSNQAKIEQLGVPEKLISQCGAVSEPVAIAMAQGVRRVSGVDVSLAVTGIAGPAGGSPQKPVGTVFIGCDYKTNTQVVYRLFNGSRNQIREKAAQAALVLLWRRLSHD